MLQELPYGLRGYFSCRRCPSVSCVFRKTSDTKKWVVLPKGFVTIPHMTMNSSYFKRAYSSWHSRDIVHSPAGDALWVQGVSIKTWDPKIWVILPMGFATIPNMTMSSSYFKKGLFLLQEMPFGFRGVL